MTREEGVSLVQERAVVLAMGARERTPAAVRIPGARPAGVFTAGMAQRLVNLYGWLPGRRAAILGSGDIGLIMARRLTLEGVEVAGVFEILPYPSGLPRNIQQCLVDFHIPLNLSTTVVEVHGTQRLAGVTVARVDGDRRPIQGTEEFVPCDTLLLSVGLIPENELSREAGIAIEPLTGGAVVDDHLMTSLDGIFSCGNVLHVHDLVDHVSEEAEVAGLFAARFALGEMRPSREYTAIRPGNGIRYCLPQRVSRDMDFYLSLRVQSPMRDKKIVVVDENGRGIIKKAYPRLHPAVMLRILIRAERILKARELEVRVE
jgi:pyruvate/2-oxoglutarate dehydrogenase complex dihydrolipoamide dehydrogenase (E3) component